MHRPTEAATYRALLRLDTAGLFFAASTLVRLPYGTVTLSLLLAVHTATGSFAAAGWALAGYAVPALSMPVKAALLDTFGERLLLAMMSIGYSACLAGVVACATRQVHDSAAFVALAVGAGMFAPPLGPATRARWARLTPDGAFRRLAYGLDTVVEETLYVVGPLLVGGLSQRSTILPLGVSVAVSLIGTIGMVAVMRPAVPPLSGSTRRRHTGHRPGQLLLPLIAVMFAVGLGMSPVEIAVLSYTHSSASTGLLLAVMSVASVAGGLVWAHRSHDALPGRQLAGLLSLSAIGVGGVALSATLHAPSPVLAVGLAIVGVCSAPTFTVVYLAADHARRPSEGVSIQSGTWINTGYNAGFAAGSAAAGVIVSTAGAPVALAAGAFVFSVAVVAYRTERRRTLAE